VGKIIVLFKKYSTPLGPHGIIVTDKSALKPHCLRAYWEVTLIYQAARSGVNYFLYYTAHLTLFQHSGPLSCQLTYYAKLRSLAVCTHTEGSNLCKV